MNFAKHLLEHPRFARWFKPAADLFVKIIWSRSTPHQVALGTAIGFIVGWSPTIGLQMAIAVPICLALRANPLAALPPIWLTNPATAVPIFGFNYWVGRLILGGPTLRQFEHEMKDVFGAIKTEGVRESLHQLFQLGKEIFWPLMLGSGLVGAALGLAGYVVVYWLVSHLRRHSAPPAAE